MKKIEDQGRIIEVDFISFIDCPDLSELIGLDSTQKLFMGIS